MCVECRNYDCVLKLWYVELRLREHPKYCGLAASFRPKDKVCVIFDDFAERARLDEVVLKASVTLPDITPWVNVGQQLRLFHKIYFLCDEDTYEGIIASTLARVTWPADCMSRWGAAALRTAPRGGPQHDAALPARAG